MDEVTRQRELDDLDAGMAPEAILRRRVAVARADRDRALAELSAAHQDEEIFAAVGLDMAQLRRGPDLNDVTWSLA